MKQLALVLFSVILFSCSSDNEPINPSLDQTETNVLEILYSGVQTTDVGGYVKEFFNSIEIEQKTEQISSTESVEVLYIKAINTENGDSILMTVFKGATGTETLFNNSFNFRHLGAGYIQSDFTFNVLVNSDTEFSAEFSGKLEHFNFPSQTMRYMDVSYGKINFEY